MRKRFIFIAPLAIAAVFLFGWIVELLWNRALAPATGWHDVTYWQALGVLVLAKILFGFGGGHHGGRRMRRKSWENWHSMTPEQREKFREAMQARYGNAWCEPRPPRESEAPADR